ncbi:MAG: GTP 3',8-cyclase MoaA [Pseudomonadota bacterium]
MSSRIVPIIDQRSANKPMPSTTAHSTSDARVLDKHGRRLHDLRISVIDRCNFRCIYCMPKSVFDSHYAFLPQQALLTFEEIERLAWIFTQDHGVNKIRLTGGEPLLRREIETLIEKLARIPGIDLTLTTNGSLLAKKAQALKDAGLNRVTVSLDSLDDTVFGAMNDVNFPVADVLAGIDEAARVGLTPIKINMVVKRGLNDQSVIGMARHFKNTGHVLRFIEYMDVGNAHGWRMDDVIPSAEIVRWINAEMPLDPIDANYEGEVAARWRYQDGTGEIGVISSVTQAFCSTCTRLRLSTDGSIYTCLFATQGHDLKTLLRGGASDEKISMAIGNIWQARDDRYSEIRTSETATLKKVEMSYIGG